MITSTASPGPTNAATIPISIDFGETVTNFVDGDLVVGNGTTGSVVDAGSGVYTAEVTPTGDGTVTVNIAAAAATDLLSNPSNAATEFSIVSDQTAPAPTITSSAGDPTGTSPIPISVDFGETVTDFVVGDLMVSNGTAGTSADAGSGRLYGPGDADGGRGGDGGHGGDGSR